MHLQGETLPAGGVSSCLEGRYDHRRPTRSPSVPRANGSGPNLDDEDAGRPGHNDVLPVFVATESERKRLGGQAAVFQAAVVVGNVPG